MSAKNAGNLPVSAWVSSLCPTAWKVLKSQNLASLFPFSWVWLCCYLMPRDRETASSIFLAFLFHSFFFSFSLVVSSEKVNLIPSFHYSVFAGSQMSISDTRELTYWRCILILLIGKNTLSLSQELTPGPLLPTNTIGKHKQLLITEIENCIKLITLGTSENFSATKLCFKSENIWSI